MEQNFISLIKNNKKSNYNLRVIPSLIISCILQQEEIIRIASLSTTRTFHSVAFSFFKGRITSFNISINRIKENKVIDKSNLLNMLNTLYIGITLIWELLF